MTKRSETEAAKRLRMMDLSDSLLPAEAAQFLGALMRTELREAQLWNMVGDAALRVSMEFLEPQYARRGRWLIDPQSRPAEATTPRYTGDEFDSPVDWALDARWGDRLIVSQTQTVEALGPDTGVRALGDDKKLLVLEAEPVPCEGIWDLLPIGDGIHAINNEIQRAVGTHRVDMKEAQGTFICRPGDEHLVWELQEQTPAEEFRSSVGIPEGCRLVFRTSELRRLAAQTLGVATDVGSIDSFNVDTALAIIGALLDHFVKPGDQAGLVADIDKRQVHGCRKTNLDSYFAYGRKQWEVGMRSTNLPVHPRTSPARSQVG